MTGSGKTYSIANVIQRGQRPTLVLAPNKTLAAQLYGEMREFFPHNAVEYFVTYYDYYQPEAYVPSTDTYIEKDASINEHIEQMRLSATKAILERRDVIVVATVSAIYGLGDPDAYMSMVLHLARGHLVDQREILRRLAELKYTRNEYELGRGNFRVRGEVIDIFPAEKGGGYFYDFTRTWSLGYAEPEAQALYDQVHEIYDRVTENLDLNASFIDYQRMTSGPPGSVPGSRASEE